MLGINVVVSGDRRRGAKALYVAPAGVRQSAARATGALATARRAISSSGWRRTNDWKSIRRSRVSAVGSIGRVQAAVEELIGRTHADELILVSQIYDHSARLRSYELARHRLFTPESSGRKLSRSSFTVPGGPCMLDRRAFLLSGLAMYGASARELFAAGPALQNPKFSTLAIYARRLFRRSQRRRRRLVDPSRHRSAERRRDAETAHRSAVADRGRRSPVEGREVGEGHRVARVGPFGARRGIRPSAAQLVLVSIPRRQRREPDRPHPNLSRRGVAGRSAPLCHRVVPAL